MFQRSCAQGRSRSIPTRTWRTSGAASAIRADRAEDLRELVQSRDLELRVVAVDRRLVHAPSDENRGMAKPRPLHVVVLHFADALDPERLPRQVFAGAPAALAAGHPRLLSVRIGPFPPGMILERALAARRQFLAALRTSSPFAASRSNATKAAGVSCASFATRDAAGWRRSCSASNSSPCGVAITISPSTTEPEGRAAMKVACSSGKYRSSGRRSR